MALDPETFASLARLVEQRTGIVLSAGKEYLVESRLTPVVRREALGSIAELAAKLRGPGTDALAARVCEAMTTNETSFFRDVHPFEMLRTKVLPGLIAARAAERKLHFWCAASSTGQEPYSVLMLLREHFPQLADWKVTFLATDLSAEVLARAKAGRFTQIEVNRGLPATLLVKYFKKDGLEWEIDPSLRKMIEFREMNLTTAWPMMPRADIIFIRNVLIYFSVDTKKQILAKARRVLRDDGFLFLGGAETTLNLDTSYERVQGDKGGFYRPFPAKAAA
ncbi:MAG TPA: protein-glutamate O-methyltransferase CheR [Humisphaera sp.]